jgi:hypothetical protein
MANEVRLLFILFDRIALMTAIDLPIDVTKVITRHILAMLHKFDRESAVGTAMIADSQTFDDGSGFDSQSFRPRDSIRLQN